MSLEKTEAKIREIEESTDIEWLKGRIALLNRIIGSERAMYGDQFAKHSVKKAELFKELVEERLQQLTKEEEV